MDVCVVESVIVSLGRMKETLGDCSMASNIYPGFFNAKVRAAVFALFPLLLPRLQLEKSYSCFDLFLLLLPRVFQYKRIRDVQDTEYFNQLLRIKRAYRISGFCFVNYQALWIETFTKLLYIPLILGKIHPTLQEISNVGITELYNFACFTTTTVQATANVKNANTNV
ncbi:hypothetical protein Tco_1459280 [Tanacetum coccineum]